ncbi:hypothetical protein [Modestobacter lacusdianchii]
MSSAPEHRAPDRPAAGRSVPDGSAPDRSDRNGSAPDRSRGAELRQRIADGRWPLFALELVVLAVIFGWLFLTVAATGGDLPW